MAGERSRSRPTPRARSTPRRCSGWRSRSRRPSRGRCRARGAAERRMALLTSVAAGVLTLTLNRPEKRNALDAATVEALPAALDQARLEATVRVIALRGAGKDFCAGADLDELLASVALAPEENERAARRLGEVFARIRELEKPVVALVQGRALAGGAGLATGCDLVLAAESSQFGYP